MRLKKQKRHRKVVRFYSACFGFMEPYKVLCDGTFIHHLLVHGLTPADDSLSSLLGARVLLFTSRCVIQELKSLGESHAEAFDAAHQLMTAANNSAVAVHFSIPDIRHLLTRVFAVYSVLILDAIMRKGSMLRPAYSPLSGSPIQNISS